MNLKIFWKVRELILMFVQVLFKQGTSVIENSSRRTEQNYCEVVADRIIISRKD